MYPVSDKSARVISCSVKVQYSTRYSNPVFYLQYDKAYCEEVCPHAISRTGDGVLRIDRVGIAKARAKSEKFLEMERRAT